jgi:Vitamin B12 dependent methionine synthase, activation domain
MTPASSVSGLLFAHPASRYFTVGRIAKEQAEDYAQRRGVPLQQVEHWLRPNLAYEPTAPLLQGYTTARSAGIESDARWNWPVRRAVAQAWIQGAQAAGRLPLLRAFAEAPRASARRYGL